MSGGAHASSFVVLGAMAEKVGPSMVVMRDSSPSIASFPDAADRTAEAAVQAVAQTELSYPTPGGDNGAPVGTLVQISPSIIAMGAPAPGVSYEQIASITPDPPKPSPRPQSTPMVIRGGIVGDAFGNSQGRQAAAGRSTQSGSSGSKGGGPIGGEPQRKEPPPEPMRRPE